MASIGQTPRDTRRLEATTTDATPRMTEQDTQPQTEQLSPPAVAGRCSGVRQLIDAAVCLALAVILFRGFHVEGYMISTGSMAPTLYGFHKRVVCPSCHFPFAVGDVGEDRDDGHSGGSRLLDGQQPPGMPGSTPAFCPNCGQGPIDVSRVPRSQGDQLLVHKHAFLLAPPRRWEVAVFRNPYKPAQAYVKRVAGLPGESIQIVDGDVYINGEICRKNLAAQRAVRIPVFDMAYRAEDAGWQDRWTAEPARIDWKRTTGGFQLSAGRADATGGDIQEPAWVQYRHWVRSHENGAAPRLAPISDIYGYNRAGDVRGGHTVRDVMLSATVRISHGAGEFVVQLTDGDATVSCVIDPAQHEVRLLTDRSNEAVRRGALQPQWIDAGRPLELEFSLIDRQALIALNGSLPFEPWPLAESPESAPPTSPVRFGARGLDVSVSEIRLYRDVYYTRGKGVNAIESPYQLGKNQYFVLGDNSPVSLDGRSWADGALDGRLFIGKPFLVHLPSKPGKVRFGKREGHFRVPDLSRIRYIR